MAHNTLFLKIHQQYGLNVGGSDVPCNAEHYSLQVHFKSPFRCLNLQPPALSADAMPPLGRGKRKTFFLCNNFSLNHDSNCKLKLIFSCFAHVQGDKCLESYYGVISFDELMLCIL